MHVSGEETAEGAQSPLKSIVWFSDQGSSDIARLGGKNASLGEMTTKMSERGIPVPPGFAVTADAYWAFIDANQLRPAISAKLVDIKSNKISLAAGAKAIRDMIGRAQFPPAMGEAIRAAYRKLSDDAHTKDLDVAVRSSATAEDLPDASFAGQQESFLNIRGGDDLLNAVRRCFASLFTDRAIVYRANHGFDHLKVALSVGIQTMVHSDTGSAGVMFSIDTETGFPNTVLISASWGLGEAVVQGIIEPDEYVVFKPLLNQHGIVPILEKTLGTKAKKIIYSDSRRKTTRAVNTSEDERERFVLASEDILTLAKWAVVIESHYGRPMDIEWAKDGGTGALFIVQARPETVQSRKEAGSLKTYSLKQKGERLLSGLAIGDAIATGAVCRLKTPAEIAKFDDGAILVTETTDPDWMPIMKRAAAIITDHGGRTSHAAIVSRELGLPAIVGTVTATATLVSGRNVTVSCAEGDTASSMMELANLKCAISHSTESHQPTRR
jgi:pyruvate, water dikinase